MKKLFFAVFTIFIVCFLFSSCGNTSEEESVSDAPIVLESEFGTRNNPCKIGENIELKQISPIVNSAFGSEDIKFDLSFTLNKSYDLFEGINAMKAKADIFTYVPVAEITFSVNGDYEDKIQFSDLFRLGFVDVKMQPYDITGLRLHDENLDTHDYIFAGNEYTYFLSREYDYNDEVLPEEIKYFTFEYKDTNGEKQEIYILPEADNVPDGGTEEADETYTGDKEQLFTAALAAEERGYYTLAGSYYKQLTGYKDSDARYKKMYDCIKKYDGTYYGESTQFEGRNVEVYIKNGYVKARFEGDEMGDTLCEMYLYGETTENLPLLAFAEGISDEFFNNTETSYKEGFAIERLEGTEFFICATENNETFTWNGFYDKVSNDVPSDILELFS